MSYRIRIPSGLLLTVLLLYTVTESHQLFSLFKGNLALTECLNGFIGEELHIAQCRKVEATFPQQSTLAFLQTLNAWTEGEYQELISTCTAMKCDCSVNRREDSKISLHQRLQTYYSVLSYRAANGQFPDLEECPNLVPSKYVLYQSRDNTQRELAEVLQELAYLIDQDWRDPWERGHTAFKQAEVYRDQGKTRSSQRAFGLAIESLEQSHEQRATSYISWSLIALGEIALEKNNLDTAELRFRESLVNSPQSGRGAFEGLILVWNMQDFSVVEMGQNFSEIRRDLGPWDFYLTSRPAQALLDFGAVDAAWNFIETAPQEAQLAAPVLGVLGQIHEYFGEIDKARQYFADALYQSIETNPLEAAAQASDLSRVEETLGNTSGAIANLELATNLNPRATWDWYHLAQLYGEVNRREDARTAVNEALSLAPGNDTFQKFLSMLGD